MAHVRICRRSQVDGPKMTSVSLFCVPGAAPVDVVEVTPALRVRRYRFLCLSRKFSYVRPRSSPSSGPVLPTEFVSFTVSILESPLMWCTRSCVGREDVSKTSSRITPPFRAGNGRKPHGPRRQTGDRCCRGTGPRGRHRGDPNGQWLEISAMLKRRSDS